MPSGAQDPEVNEQDLKITAKEIIFPTVLKAGSLASYEIKLPFYVF